MDVPPAISPSAAEDEPPPRLGGPARWVAALRRVPPRVRAAAAAAVLLAAVPLMAWQRCGLRGCPNVQRLTAYRPGGAPRLLDREGRPFASLAPVEAPLVRLATLPRVVPDAIVAVEDRRFRSHRGIDVIRGFGALVVNLRAGGYEQGFSTITMQLARTVFAERIPQARRTLSRKVLEMRVAQEIEREFSKDQILELYLNHVWFGNGARGVEAAALHYFAAPARKLDLPKAALLAALLKAPSRYDPRRHPGRAKARRDLVVSLMERQGRITPAAAEEARAAPLGVVGRVRAGRAEPGVAPYFVEQVRRELEELFGDALYDEPLLVSTGIDVPLQTAAEEELEKQLQAVEKGAAGRFRGPRYAALPPSEEAYGYLQGAFVALDPRDGVVRAWVGGRDFRHSRFDRVSASTRQTGSAFKPFVYAAALAAGHSLAERVVDEPIEVRLDARRTWEPRNYDGTYRGGLSLREALVHSRNVPAVRLALGVGMPQVVETARRAGVASSMDPTPALALGTVAVSPLELAGAYGAFATLGTAVTPRLVLRVARPSGEVLWTASAPAPRAALDPGVAYLVTDVLADAVRRGTGAAVRQAGVSGPVAGKTGTTNDGTDAWFVGYTPELVAAVWMGFDRTQPVAPTATGGRLAAPVFARAVARWQKGRAMPPAWPRPSSVVTARVDPGTGLVVEEGCDTWDEPVRELFLRQHLPRPTCPSWEPPWVADDWPREDEEDEAEERWRRRREEEIRRVEERVRDILREMRRRRRRGDGGR